MNPSSPFYRPKGNSIFYLLCYTVKQTEKIAGIVFLKFLRRYLGYMTRQYANLFLKAAGLFPNVCKRGLDVISFSQAAKAEVGSLDIRAIVKVQFGIGWIGSLRC